MRTIAALAALSLSLLAAAASAATIEVKNAYIPAPPPGAPTAVGYGVITNHGPTSDRLMDGHSGAAASVQLHQMSTTGGVMRMRPVAGGLPIGASASVKLSPDGYHLMLIGLKAPLRVGQHVRVVLRFQRSGNVTVDFPVRAPAAAGGMHM